MSQSAATSKTTKKPKIAWRRYARQKLQGNILSTHLKEKVEKIEQIITKLIEESAKGKPIVVEGKKDAQALQELGVNGAIFDGEDWRQIFS